MPLDVAILKFFDLTLATPALDFIFLAFSNFRPWAIPICILILLLLWRGGVRARWMVVFCLLAVAIVDPTVHYIWKPLFARLRPCQVQELFAWLRLIDGCGGRYGFPSSHAANALSQAVVIGGFYVRARKYVYPLAILISLSRVYLGVHYPSDVLGGALFGAAVGIVLLYIANTVSPGKIGKYIRHRN